MTELQARQQQHEAAQWILYGLLTARQFSVPAPAKPGMVVEQRCLKLAGLAASSRVVEWCCSTVLVMSPSCVCGVVQRGPLTLPAVLGLAPAGTTSCAAAGCWPPHGDVSEAVKDAKGVRLTVLLRVRFASYWLNAYLASMAGTHAVGVTRVTGSAHMVEKPGLSGAVGSQQDVCCCTWLCWVGALQAVADQHQAFMRYMYACCHASRYIQRMQ